MSHATFATILRPDINVVSIPRPLAPRIREGLEQVAAESTFAHEAQLDTKAPDARSLLESVDDKVLRQFLAEDIGFLTQKLGAILDRRHLHAKLFVQRSDGCRKIHTDYVKIRLLCTYAGPGTEWLPEENLVRKWLGPSDVDTHTANLRILREGTEPRRCEPAEILLLKGEAHPGNAGRGAAHRSPPLGSSGLSRLVLKIDEARCGC